MGQGYGSPTETILCIADYEAILLYEKAMLEKAGYAVLSAASAQEGLRLVTMCECDAVLLDYEMPGVNVHEVTIELKRLRPGMKVILFYGCNVPRQTLALVDAFVHKLEASRQLLPLMAELWRRDPTAPHDKQTGL